MKISELSNYDLCRLMGDGAIDADAEAMRTLLAEKGLADTGIDNIDDDLWFSLARDASESATKFPKRSEIASLLRDLVPYVPTADEWEPENRDDTEPYLLVTVGSDKSGNWGYQTGDTSFTGGAYGFPFWAQVYLSADSDCDQLALEILNELEEEAAGWQ